MLFIYASSFVQLGNYIKIYLDSCLINIQIKVVGTTNQHILKKMLIFKHFEKTVIMCSEK